jgi:lipopolysaccharide export system permease protein
MLLGTGYSIDAKVNLDNKQKKISTIILLAFYDKFVIAFACFMMF